MERSRNEHSVDPLRLQTIEIPKISNATSRRQLQLRMRRFDALTEFQRGETSAHTNLRQIENDQSRDARSDRLLNNRLERIGFPFGQIAERPAIFQIQTEDHSIGTGALTNRCQSVRTRACFQADDNRLRTRIEQFHWQFGVPHAGINPQAEAIRSQRAVDFKIRIAELNGVQIRDVKLAEAEFRS